MIASPIAGAAGVDDGGFQQDQGESLISYDTLEFRLNVCMSFFFFKLIP
jgi:hypothetical protein